MKKIYFCVAFLLATLPLTAIHAAGASLYLDPTGGVYRVGQTFDVRILANTDGQAINAAEAEISYNPKDFSVESLSVDHSILSSWSTPPAYDGTSGIIRFSGWADKKFVGEGGLLVTATLRPLRVTQSVLSFNSGATLSVDGKGSNILNTMTSGTYNISPAQIDATPPPAVDDATTSSSQPTPSSVEQGTSTVASQPTQNPALDQAAAVAASGFDLAILFIPFFALLTLVAFGIAYLLHRSNLR